jgi:Transposase IS66 family
VLADLRQVPLAIEAVRRIDEIFAVEREINGAGSEQRHAVRQEQIKPLVAALEAGGRAAENNYEVTAPDLINCCSHREPLSVQLVEDIPFDLAPDVPFHTSSGAGHGSENR